MKRLAVPTTALFMLIGCQDAPGPNNSPPVLFDISEAADNAPAVVLLIDQSGSMTAAFDGTDRWDAVFDVLMDPTAGIVSELESQLRFGLTLYTYDDGPVCPLLIEVPPALNNYSSMFAAYDPEDPIRHRPTADAIASITPALAAIEGPKAIIVVTDGEPDTCDEPDPQNGQPAALAAVQDAFANGITVHVIAVGEDVSDSFLQDMANAGAGFPVPASSEGPNAPFSRANNQQQLREAFDSTIDGLLPQLIEAAIDIKPGSDPNSINCNNQKETIAVAILSTNDFDATTVDHTTVTFAGASETHVNRRTRVARRHEEDVDGDGDTDLVLHFRLGDTDLDCGSTDGTLTGETFDGQAIEGTDAVRMINRDGGQPPTASGQLFGIEGSTLVTIDRTTGTMTPVGPIGIDPATGLSVDASGTLFSTSHDPRRPGPQLITIDPLTGAGTPVGNVQPDLGAVNAIAFHPSGSLFGISLRDLVSISPLTGAVTVIGLTGFGDPGAGGFIRDVDFDAAGTLFGVTRDFGDPTMGIPGTPSQLITIDDLTGAATTVAFLDDPAADLLGIAFDAGGLLFGVSCGDRPSLVTINRSTGALTTVGPLGPSPPDLCAHDLAFAEQ